MKYLKIALFFFLTQAYSQDIRVAAASDLQFALTDIAKLFETQCDCNVLVSFGSSGNFYSQIEQGAPFDIFFSASSEYTQQLEVKGFIETNTRQLYAVGRLVIWAHQQLGLDATTLKELILLDDGIQHIAIANPDHAPYGQAAVDFLNRTGLYEKISPKLIYGENISQAAQLALSSGEAGIIALSIALNPTMQEAGTYWLIPLDDHIKLDQEMVILKNQNRAEVQAFYSFIQSDESKTILKQYGFILP